MGEVKPRARNAQPVKLTERDTQLFQTLYEFDGMLASRQIERLFFNGADPSRVRQRMRQLFDNSYVAQPTTKGKFPEWVYWLDTKGYHTVAQQRGAEQASSADLRQRDPPSEMWVRHHLMVNDLRIAVVEAAALSPTLTLSQWVNSRTFKFWRATDKVTYRTRSGKQETQAHEPDGYFVVRRPSVKHPGKREAFAFLLEVDRATEDMGSFENEKVRRGMAYLRSAIFRERFGVNFGRYLVVTTSEERMTHMRQAAIAGGGAANFWFTTFTRIGMEKREGYDYFWLQRANIPNMLTDPLWFQADIADPASLIPDPTTIIAPPAAA